METSFELYKSRLRFPISQMQSRGRNSQITNFDQNILTVLFYFILVIYTYGIVWHTRWKDLYELNKSHIKVSLSQIQSRGRKSNWRILRRPCSSVFIVLTCQAGARNLGETIFALKVFPHALNLFRYYRDVVQSYKQTQFLR